MISEILLVVGLMTPISERMVELVKGVFPTVDRRILATVSGLALAPLLWWVHGGLNLVSCFVAGALVSLPSGALHDVLELLKGVKENTRSKIVFGRSTRISS